MYLYIIIHKISSCSALVLNLLLLPIILLRSPKYIGFYKYFLFLYVLSATLYSFCHFMCTTVFHATPGAFILFCSADYFPRNIMTAFLVMVCNCFASNLVIVCVSFIYRYCVLCKKKWLSFFEPGFKLYILIILLVCYVLGASSSIVLTAPNEELDILLHNVFLEDFHVNASSMAYLAYPAYTSEGGIFWPGAIPMIIFTGTAFWCANIELLCIWKMLGVFKQVQQSYSIKMEKRLFYVLILQTIFPIVLNGIPLMISDAMAFLGTPIISLYHFLGALETLAQIFDPILIIFMVKEYRRTLMKVFRIRMSIRIDPSAYSASSPPSHLQSQSKQRNSRGAGLV